jgi:hypothetical protein|tara:strand:- start:3 stop:611 length:609 start_codon:yes stop_codon:yes gene_type:complete
MANPMYGQNKFDQSADFIVGDNNEAFIQRNVISLGATTAETDLTAAQSGSLIVLNGTPSQIQVINLPTIKDGDVGTYFEFIVTVIGNSAAAGSYTINTGGHATDPDSATKGYDDFVGTLKIVDNVAVTTADKSNIVPAGGEGALIIADDTTNGVADVGTSFTLTAIVPSTIGTAAANVWLIDGTMMTAQATSFVTTNVFTAP